MTESAATPYERARELLQPPMSNAGLWPVLAAMALAATAAVLMAGAIILGPGFEVPPPSAISAISAEA